MSSLRITRSFSCILYYCVNMETPKSDYLNLCLTQSFIVPMQHISSQDSLRSLHYLFLVSFHWIKYRENSRFHLVILSVSFSFSTDGKHGLAEVIFCDFSVFHYRCIKPASHMCNRSLTVSDVVRLNELHYFSQKCLSTQTLLNVLLLHDILGSARIRNKSKSSKQTMPTFVTATLYKRLT